MIRIIVILAGTAGPAQACSTQGNSTFCPEGWVAVQPMTRDRPEDGVPEGGDADAGEIYVEGAVMIDHPATGDEEPL